MKVVVIDTQILSWAIVKVPPVGNQHLVAKSQDFMQWVKEQKFHIIIPSIVAGELMTPVNPEKHNDVLIELVRNFRIVPFDLAAAKLFAEISG